MLRRMPKSLIIQHFPQLLPMIQEQRDESLQVELHWLMDDPSLRLCSCVTASTVKGDRLKWKRCDGCSCSRIRISSLTWRQPAPWNPRWKCVASWKCIKLHLHYPGKTAAEFSEPKCHIMDVFPFVTKDDVADAAIPEPHNKSARLSSLFLGGQTIQLASLTSEHSLSLTPPRKKKTSCVD